MFERETIRDDIAQAKLGSSSAWTRLHRRFAPVLCQWANQYKVYGELSQQDLVQVAWTRVMSKISSYSGPSDEDSGRTVASFYSWLKNVAKSAMINVIRDARARKRKPTNAPEVLTEKITNGELTPSKSLVKKEDIERIKSAIECLNEDDQQIVKMVFWDGLSLKQVSTLLEIEYTKFRRRFYKILDSINSH